MARITTSGLMEAVRKACQSEIEDRMLLNGPDPLLYASTDYEAATICGADTLAVAAWARRGPGSIYARLTHLWKSGELIRIGANRKTYRWWPINFHHEVGGK